jgi:glycosyltransferase involved in cell wall biosynthesis
LTFPEERADILQAHLSNLLRDLHLRGELARRGRERVLARFTQAQVAARTHEVYQAVLATGH